MLDPTLESSFLESYTNRREERLKEAINEYLDDDSYEEFVDNLLGHFKQEYEFHSRKCSMLKQLIELLHQSNIQ